MMVLGWLFLLILTLWCCGGFLAVFVGSLSLGAKMGVEVLVLFALAALMVWACYANFPFEIALRP